MSATSATQGRILDRRYELRELIGHGTFGRVFRGHDQRLDRSVAIKVIKPGWTEDPEWVERFEREAQMMARVSHPGIVQVHDIGHDQGRLYYVAELVDGESLAACLSEGPLPPARARDIAEQLCRALAEAHAQRVVHRDIKPANVLIGHGGRVKVGDFGIARLAPGAGEGIAGTISGTPGYMAPEQARGSAPTPASDVYSAGVVLAEMLGGSPPPSLAKIVERALAQDPAQRYPSAREMAEALAGADLAVVRAPPPRPELGSPGPVPTRVRLLSPRINVNPSERRRYRVLVAAVALLLFAMIATAILTATGTTRVPRLLGMGRHAIAAKARTDQLRVSFTTRYDQAATGTAIGQRPAAGRLLSDGSTVRVVLSAGPRPVEVPQLVGQRQVVAQAILAHLRLAATVSQVPAPGVTPGVVVEQSPGPTTSTAAHSVVALSVAEVPRWRPLTSFSGDRSVSSVPFRIRGDRWRVLYSMGWDGTCGFFGLFCSGPTAQVVRAGRGATFDRFGLSSGSGQTEVFNSGPGTFQINVSPGSDSAHWSIQVEDDY